jgi:predicted metal-dependent phosphoesterase TrpH
MVKLTIEITEELDAELRKFCQQQRLSPEDAIREILRRRLAVRKFRELAAGTEKYARAAGFSSEEDILGTKP